MLPPAMLPQKKNIEPVKPKGPYDDSGKLDAAFTAMQNENSSSVLQSGLEMMLTMVNHLIKEPENMRYRRVPPSNQLFKQKVSGVKGHEAFMTAVGFKKMPTSGTWQWNQPDDVDDKKKQNSIMKLAVDKIKELREASSIRRGASQVSGYNMPSGRMPSYGQSYYDRQQQQQQQMYGGPRPVQAPYSHGNMPSQQYPVYGSGYDPYLGNAGSYRPQQPLTAPRTNHSSPSASNGSSRLSTPTAGVTPAVMTQEKIETSPAQSFSNSPQPHKDSKEPGLESSSLPDNKSPAMTTQNETDKPTTVSDESDITNIDD